MEQRDGRPGRKRPGVSQKPDPVGPALSLGEDGTLPADAVEVAVVSGAFGIQGGLRLKPFSPQPQALLSSPRWWLRPGAGKAAGPVTLAPGLPPVLHITHARLQGEAVVATCRELSDRDAAQQLVGARVFVARAGFPEPEEGEFYWVDLIGLEVRDRARRLLGKVTHLLQTGPHSVLCVQPAAADAAEVLIPFVAAYVDRVDRDGKTIHVDWQDDY